MAKRINLALDNLTTTGERDLTFARLRFTTPALRSEDAVKASW